MAANTPLDIEKAPAAPPRTKILASGAVYDLDKGRIIKQDNSKNPHAITKENSRDFRLKRQEKTAALLRRRIVEAHNGSMPSPVHSSAEAFAEAGAMIYEQVVINSEEHARDRLEAFEKLGRYADVLGDPRGNNEPTQLEQVTDVLNAASLLLALLSGKPKTQIHEAESVVDGSVE